MHISASISAVLLAMIRLVSCRADFSEQLTSVTAFAREIGCRVDVIHSFVVLINRLSRRHRGLPIVTWSRQGGVVSLVMLFLEMLD